MPEQLDLLAVETWAADDTTATVQPPPDHVDRARIADDLGATLFVEAGAGSGKTTALVRRIVNLVASGIPIDAVAAITFTEKAAADLRRQVREALHASARGGTDGPFERALAELDHAPIGTLHAFARRILLEYPIEAGLPPSFEVLDEIQSATEFDQRFTDLLDGVLDDVGNTRLVELCEYDGFRLDRGGRQMAEDFQANWDLVVERVGEARPGPRELPLTELAALCRVAAAVDVPPDDTQVETVRTLAALGARLDDALDLSDALHAIVDLAAVRARGNATKWKRHTGTATAVGEYREAVERASALARSTVEAVNEERRLLLGSVLRTFTLDAVAARRGAGTLEFHDLLVFARKLVAEHPGVRRQLHRRYQRLLLDEFQDTDPIQLELAVRITADPGGTPDDWRTLRPLPGRLFVVGDPKQSVYRFRRADIGQYLRARDQIGAASASLDANFRTEPAVIDWINTTMAGLIVGEPDVQPDFHPLAACRPSTATGSHGTVTALGAAVADEPLDAEALRAREATDVAAVITRALAERWPVQVADGDGRRTTRACRLGDITILLPARTSLPALEAALRDHGIAYRAENSSLVYAAPEVRSLLLALRAADDPTDELTVVSVLRSALFGCSDADLYDWHAARGNGWSPFAAIAEDERDHPVAIGLRALRELATAVPWSTPAELLGGLIDERRVLELAFARVDHRDVWRRVRFVVDQARAWSDAGGHGLRNYLTWTRLQGEEGKFVAETVLPETDDDAVRVMTVHAAKGLEFPITIVSGLTTEHRSMRGRRIVWPPGTWALTDPNDVQYQQFAPIDEQMSDAERRRLLYVACTRACDHLVVSLHRTPRSRRSSALLLAGALDPALHREFDGVAASLPRRSGEASELPWADVDEWATERAGMLAAAHRPTALSASALARIHDEAHPKPTHRTRVPPDVDDPGLAKDAVDVDLPPWQRGRYGTAIGRAVHAVLQLADLADGHDVAALATAQAAAEGVLGHEATVEALARSALAAPIVRLAPDVAHWRELFVAVELGGIVVEGYVDLLVRHPERGLVVVDYKTDRLGDASVRERRLEHYRIQLAAYGVVLDTVLGEPIAAGIVVLCRAGRPAEQIEIADWAQAMDEVRTRAMA